MRPTNVMWVLGMKWFQYFFFSSRRRHTRLQGDWSSDVCSSDLIAPGSCMLEWCDAPGAIAAELAGKKARWNPLIAEMALEPDGRHELEPAGAAGPATHVRLNIYPDGGVARLRVFGMAAQPG